MTSFRANDHRSHDPRILIIHDMEDFDLWQNRAELNEMGIHALAFDYLKNTDTSIEDLNKAAQEISFFMREQERKATETNESKTLKEGLFFSKGNSYSELYSVISGTTKKSQAIDSLVTTFNEICTDQTALKIIRDMASISYDSGIMGGLKSKTLDIRTNATFPGFFHVHKDTLTMSLNKTGTIIDSGTIKDRNKYNAQKRTNPLGKPFETPAGTILLFDKTIGHRAPQKEDEGVVTEEYNDDVDRVNLLIG